MPNNVGGSLGGSSLMLTTSQSSFDVRSETDVISLLRLIHVNTINPDLKNHLRDLIFAFRQDQDFAMFAELQAAFIPLGVTLVGAEVVSSQPIKLEVKTNFSQDVHTEKKSTLGIMRPQPRFVPVSSATPVVEESAVQATPTPTPTPALSFEPVVEKIVSAVPTPTPIATPAPVVEVPKYVEHVEGNYIERIKEIKKEVNEKVGNPVNLIDANNEVGREYMNALLDAMKKSNGGQPEEIKVAMERLESAFATVQKVIIGGNTPQPIAPINTVPEVVAPITVEVTTAPSHASPIPEPVEVEEVHSNTDAHQVLEHVGQFVPITKNPLPEDLNTPIRKVQPETSVPPLMPSVMDILTKKEPQIEVAQKNTEVGAVMAHSVAKEKQLQDLMRANREKESQTLAQQEAIKIASMDPLQTPEVTAGLGQLLSEWSLFKSSGIFGTGPSGKDHVLYTKLAPLTMAAVIAGRFEGVTPKIKQSITDYMNGWRYEEGIVHEHGETFEHYLRRVIFHILEKQKKK